MKLNTSGSCEQILSSLHFLKNGQMETVFNNEEEIDQYDMSVLLLTHRFITYALDRDDWMMTFLEIVNDDLEKTSRELSRPNLTIIQGGKTDD